MNSILLIAPAFHSYYKNMISEFENLGFSVDYFEDEMKTDTNDLIKGKAFKNHLQKKFNNYFDYQINNRKDKQYNYVILVFGGRYFLPEHIQILRKAFKTARLIYYTWDSVSNFPRIKDFYFLFDSFFSFDPIDCQTYNFTFLPLFYCNTFIPKKTTNDVCALMTFGRKKSNGVKAVIKALPGGLKASIHLIMENKLVYIYNKIVNPKIFSGIAKNCFSFKPLSRTQSENLYSSSKVTIDCPLRNQNGLTMRTFEVLAMHRKLITTNVNIVNYDFYSQNNILVFSESIKTIPQSFFDSPFSEEKALSSKYSLTTFVKTLIER